MNNNLIFTLCLFDGLVAVIVAFLLNREHKLTKRNNKRIALLSKTFRAMEHNP